MRYLAGRERRRCGAAPTACHGCQVQDMDPQELAKDARSALELRTFGASRGAALDAKTGLIWRRTISTGACSQASEELHADRPPCDRDHHSNLL